MVASLMRWLMPAPLCALACAAAAQTPPSAAPKAHKADPLDARVAVPALVYESALSRYRRAGADKPMPWIESNDTVARIGGWRAYAREAQQPDAPPPAPPPAPQPAPHGHGHGGHKMP